MSCSEPTIPASGRLASLSEEARYRLLVQAVIDYALYMLDTTGVVVSWNPGAERVKHYTAAEILGRHFSCFYSEEDRSAGLPQRALDTAAREGRFECEGWRIRKDGSRFWAHVIVDAVRDERDGLLGFVKITRDLTERKAAADALRQSQEQFRLLVQGVTDYALYMLDPQGRVTSWNAGAERIKGYNATEIIGQSFSRFYTEEDRSRGDPERGLETALREGRFETEGWRQRKDGSRFWAHAVIDPIRDENGTVIGFAKITRDISERMRAQRALEETRETLFQSQKLDALGRLTGGIAHDFNNLLMAVLGSLEIVRRRVSHDPAVLGLVDNAIRGAQRGSALTQRMLAFARSQTTQFQSIDVATLVSGMGELLQRSLGPSVWIESNLPSNLRPVRADSNQLELALLNLTMNARDAMPQGGAIMLSAWHADISVGDPGTLACGSYVCLAVTDTGTGMEAAVLQRAMEPFFTTKDVGKGTGLGLSMVHGMAEQWGGRLLLKSQVGVGTTAELWLPVFPVEVKGAAADSSADEVAPPRTSALSVLAVDDDGLVLMNTVAMLEELGHTVFAAGSAQQALDIIRREQQIALVVTDQAMPRMSGLQLADAIHAERPGLPVVLATGYTELPAGMRVAMPRLIKPFRLEDLRGAIKSAMTS